MAASNYTTGSSRRVVPYNTDNRTIKSSPSRFIKKSPITVVPQITDEQKRRKIFARKYAQTPDADEKYERVTKIGQGTFGEVFKAKNKETKQFVALKRVIMDHEKEGFPITSLREIKILQTLNRQSNMGNTTDQEKQLGYANIVQLIEVCRGKMNDDVKPPRPSVYLVFEFCAHDLHGLLTGSVKEFQLDEKKSIVKQMLEGLLYIHGKKIFHRDMKTANVLVTDKGILKLADFGLARPSYVTTSRQLTNKVVTLWYRPPELLLGDTAYTAAIDMWGCGCIMAELWRKGKPILCGEGEMEQLDLIFKLCGSIELVDWPKAKKLKGPQAFEGKVDFQKKPRKIKTQYSAVIEGTGVNLLDEMLRLNPDRRPSAHHALDNAWFWEPPAPKQPDLTTISKSHFEYIVRQENQKKQAKKKLEKTNPKPSTKAGLCTTQIY